ncbi:MAG: dienelactone hydrolase family protein [Pyrinomonadaceae bacterium]|nr:dienelactone hydrolase family protein [Pyrinomonadaceae bacterium]
MANDILSVIGNLLPSVLLANAGKKPGNIVNRTTQIDAENFGYQVYLPSGIETTSNLPLLVFLHGIRERGSGGLIEAGGAMSVILKQYLKQIPAIVLFPQCRPGKYWSDLTMEQMVMRAIERTGAEFNADLNRLSLVGVSMGGYGVWHFALRHPQKFAALVSICGGSPLLKGNRFTPIAEKVGKTPAWLFHGAEDKIVPVGESRELVKAIKANQGNVKYNEYAGVGHHVWLKVLGEKGLLPWLLPPVD